MIYKYNFSISGDNFYPEKVIEKIQGNFIVDSFFNPNDQRGFDLPGIYGYGGISFWHPLKFSTGTNIIDYEYETIEFIEGNYQLFTENGVDDLQVFIEIYSDERQCNFEIFNKELLKKLASFEVSLPISVYVLNEEEIQKWENEIELTWKCRRTIT